MKLIRGKPLEALLQARPDASHDRGWFVAAFEQRCQAVAYAHAHHVIHRDLKPANVMLGDVLRVTGDIPGTGAAFTETGRLDPRFKGLLAQLPPLLLAPPPREVKRA